MFSRLSTKITQEIMEGEGLMEWIKEINPLRCKSEAAWEGKHFKLDEHYFCTLAIAASDPLIEEYMNEIEDINKLDQVTLDLFLEDMWLLFEDMTLQEQHDESRDLNKTLAKILELRRNKDIPLAICSKNQECAKAFRKMVLQLKLIQLGYYGPSQTTAGLYLAHHRGKLGAYFSNSKNNRWPHQPLSYPPNEDEKLLDKYLSSLSEALSISTIRMNKNWKDQLHRKLDNNENFTENGSKGRMESFSLLDIPAFGSRLLHLTEFQTNSPNWLNEVNFAISKEFTNNTELGMKFRDYKYLFKFWGVYIENYLKTESSTELKHLPATELNYLPDIDIDKEYHPFNFTNYIQDENLTFLQVYTLSHPTATDNSIINGQLTKVASKVLGSTLDKGFVKNNGLFDKLLLDCSFREQFMPPGQPLKGKCDLFQQSLTSNGLCLSFNTETPSKIWNNDTSYFAKAIEEIGNVKKMQVYNFGGAGSNEGRLNHLSGRAGFGVVFFIRFSMAFTKPVSLQL